MEEERGRMRLGKRRERGKNEKKGGARGIPGHR